MVKTKKPLMSKEKKTLIFKCVGQSYIWILLLLMYLPVLVLMIYSFTVGENGGDLNLGEWGKFSFDLYINLFKDAQIQRAIGNTVIIALLAATLATIIGTMGAIGVYECKKLPKRSLEFLTQIPVVNPEIVIALSLIVVFVALGIHLSFWTLLLGHLVLTVPFVYLSVKPKLIQMDPALYEAALDLGCTPRQALRKAVFPEIVPGIFSGFLIAITLSLDDFIVTAFTTGPGLLSGNSDIQTISTYVEGIIKKHPLPAELRALCTIIFLLVLLLAICFTILQNRKAKKNKKRKGRAY